MLAKIYQPSPSAMTSGRAKRHWVLEFMGNASGVIDPLTGTKRSTDVRSQLDLKFDTLSDAVAYAKANNIPHQVVSKRQVAGSSPAGPATPQTLLVYLKWASINSRNAGQSSLTTPWVPGRIQKAISALGVNSVNFVCCNPCEP